MHVIQLLTDPVAKANLARAVRMVRAAPHPRSLLPAASWDDVAQLIQEHPGAIAVVDPYFGGSFEVGPVESVARAAMSHVIVYASFRDRPAGRHVPQLLAAGVGEVLTQGVDDSPDRVAGALEAALGQRQIEPVLEQLRDALSWRVFLFAQAAIRAGPRRTSVREVAALLGVHPRTVRRWFEGESTGARRLLRWAHLLNAARVISATGAEPPAAACRLGFSRYSALSRHYRELTGRALVNERLEEVFPVVARSFLAEIVVRDQDQGA